MVRSDGQNSNDSLNKTQKYLFEEHKEQRKTEAI